MEVRPTDQESRTTKRSHGSFDWTSAAAFVGATVLGIASVVNHVHDVFKKKCIMNRHDGERTPYASAYEDYFSNKMKSAESGKHLSAEEKRMYSGKVPENARVFSSRMEAALKQGASEAERATITQEYMANRKTLIKAFDAACDRIGWEQLQIPYENQLKKWTVGTWKKAQVLGDTVQREALIRFGTVAVVGLGAVAVLKHSRNVLDRIEQKLEQHDETRSR